MFAVPGWSVAATGLKRQTEADVKKDAVVPKEHSRASRKRKRKPTNPNEQPLGPARALTQPDAEVVDEDQSNATQKQRSGDAITATEAAAETKVLDDEPSSVAASSQTKTRKDKKKERKQQANGSNAATQPVVETTMPKGTTTAAVVQAPKALTPLQQKMRDKLVSARFRHLNETLYTAPSATSLSLFADNPAMFEDYHSGFRQQVAVWPENPVDTFIASLTSRAAQRWPSARSGFHGKGGAKNRKSGNAVASEQIDDDGGDDAGKGLSVAAARALLDPLPRTGPTCVIADLGCGDAVLAQRLTASGVTKQRHLVIHSYDLAAPNRFITKADVADLPLKDGSVDVAVFCLALMGTNWLDFIEESYRVLRWKGELWVAEIKSRFGRQGKGGAAAGEKAVVDHSVGKRRKVGAGGSAGRKEGERRARENEESQQEEVLRKEVDGEDAREETDVSAFVAALERRGFVLRKGQESVDLSNKMFVRMEFVKAAPARVGKGVKVDADGGVGGKRKKFVEQQAEEMDPAVEAKVLKPCLYKIR